MSKRIAIKLREAMQAYKRRTGARMTYEILADMTGIAIGTLQNMGSNLRYNSTLTTVAKICEALDVTPAELLELVEVPERPKRPSKKKRKRI